MNKHTSKTALMLKLALALTFASTTTLADSPREWGYWDAASAAGPTSTGSDGFSSMTNSQNLNTAENNNSGNGLNNEQNSTRLKRDLTKPASKLAAVVPNKSDYVGYNVCYYNCNTSSSSGSHYYYYYEQPETAGKMYVDIQQGAERVAERTHYESRYRRNGKPYVVSDNYYYDAKFSVDGAYDGMQFNVSNIDGTIQEYFSTYYWGDTYSGSYFSTNNLGGYSIGATLDNKYNGETNSQYFWGHISGKSYGQFVLGKPVAAAQIAQQLRLGQTYHFSGHSAFGSQVQIAVNFQNASWKGSWSGNSGYYYQNQHNGFTAAGGISGSTLTSKNVAGIGKAGVGYVTGGKVDATLVGAIKGTDVSKAAIIGSTIVDVQQKVGTKTMGDVFGATAKR